MTSANGQPVIAFAANTLGQLQLVSLRQLAPDHDPTKTHTNQSCILKSTPFSEKPSSLEDFDFIQDDYNLNDEDAVLQIIGVHSNGIVSRFTAKISDDFQDVDLAETPFYSLQGSGQVKQISYQNKNGMIILEKKSGKAVLFNSGEISSYNGEQMGAQPIMEFHTRDLTTSNIYAKVGVDAISTWQSLLATGGKENDLQIFDLKRDGARIFEARNVPHDFLGLRVPIWITGIEFISNDKLVTCTGEAQIRLYDTKASQEPVWEFDFKNEKLHKNQDWMHFTSVSLINTSTDNHLWSGKAIAVADNRGNLGVFDLDFRQRKILKRFKGHTGSITSTDSILYIPRDIKPKANRSQELISVDRFLIAGAGYDRTLRLHPYVHYSFPSEDFNPKLKEHRSKLRLIREEQRFGSKGHTLFAYSFMKTKLTRVKFVKPNHGNQQFLSGAIELIMLKDKREAENEVNDIMEEDDDTESGDEESSIEFQEDISEDEEEEEEQDDEENEDDSYSSSDNDDDLNEGGASSDDEEIDDY